MITNQTTTPRLYEAVERSGKEKFTNIYTMLNLIRTEVKRLNLIEMIIIFIKDANYNAHRQALDVVSVQCIHWLNGPRWCEIDMNCVVINNFREDPIHRNIGRVWRIYALKSVESSSNKVHRKQRRYMRASYRHPIHQFTQQ